MRQAPHDRDPRWRRTRDALQSAFTLLALERRYHEIRIDDILKASGVGRSTFYEHFAGKDALLAASMEAPLSLLADMPTGKASVQQWPSCSSTSGTTAGWHGACSRALHFV